MPMDSRDTIAHYLHDMEAIADAMAVEKYWDRPQYVILKKMYLDLKTMHYSFCLIGGVPWSQVPGSEGQQGGLPRD